MTGLNLGLPEQIQRGHATHRHGGGEWLTIAMVQPSSDWAETLVNLSAYSGQVINLRFAWIATTSADTWSVDMVGVDNAWR